MLKAARNIIIVVALIAAAVAAYVSFAPSRSYSIRIVNRSGQSVTGLDATVTDSSGKTIGSLSGAALSNGEDAVVGHTAKYAQLSMSFVLGDKELGHHEPNLSFADRTTVTFEIQSDGSVRPDQTSDVAR